MNAEYWKGFHDGKRAGKRETEEKAEREAREKAAQLLAFYLESLKDVPGIGPKLWERIVEHINTIDVRKGGDNGKWVHNR
jgi:hypothetical protein